MCYFLMQHLFFLLFLHSHGDAFTLEFLHEIEEVGVELIEFAHFATFPDDVFGNAGKKFMYIISKKVLSLLDVCEIGFFEDFLELGQRTGNLFHVFPLFFTSEEPTIMYKLFLLQSLQVLKIFHS